VGRCDLAGAGMGERQGLGVAGMDLPIEYLSRVAALSSPRMYVMTHFCNITE
jgi:hypothetical protein